MDFLDWNWAEIYKHLELAYVIGINYVLVALLAIQILLDNRNPQKTYAYILVLFIAPIIGIIVYLTFGQNYRRNKMFNRKRVTDKSSFQKIAALKNVEGRIDPNEMPSAAYSHKKVIQLLKNTSNSILTGSNELEIHSNGEQAFPAMLEALKNAQNHIHLEYYIFNDDALGKEFINILVEKAKAGLEVRFIYDSVGSLGLSNEAIRKMVKAGVRVRPFLPIRFPLFGSRINYRNHRKILVIDGKIGFTGGINIDRKYDNRQKNELFWRDTNIMIKGMGVWTLQSIFMFDWIFCSNEDIEFERNYFPGFEKTEKVVPIQIAASGPDSDWSSIMQAFFAGINQARETIRITTPYFVPNESIRTSIKTATMGGINVELMVPYDSDSKIVRMAMRSFFKGLLKAGVKIYQYKKGFVHAKTITIDESMCSVGTANMDMRSFDLNFEVNAFCYDTGITKDLINRFEEDKKDCEILTLNEVRKWNLLQRFGYSTARLFAPLL